MSLLRCAGCENSYLAQFKRTAWLVIDERNSYQSVKQMDKSVPMKAQSPMFNAVSCQCSWDLENVKKGAE